MKRATPRRAAAKVAAANTYELELAAMRERCAATAAAANAEVTKRFEAQRERDRALDQCSTLRATLEEERTHDAAERKRLVAERECVIFRAKDIEESRDELAHQLEQARQLTREVAAAAATPPRPPVNEHADAHETIAQLGELLTNLAEARARALRAPPAIGAGAVPSTTEIELRAALGDALDLLFSDAVSFVDGGGVLLARGVRDRAIRLGCGKEEVSS